MLLPLQPISTALARAYEPGPKQNGAPCVPREDVNCRPTVSYNGPDKRDATARKVIPVKKCNTSLVWLIPFHALLHSPLSYLFHVLSLLSSPSTAFFGRSHPPTNVQFR